MSWETAKKTPIEIVQVHLKMSEFEGSAAGLPEQDPQGEMVKIREATYQFVVRYDDNTDDMREGNLIPHLTAEEKTWLNDFLTSKISQIEEAVL